jgi:hypothetical protein
MPIRIRSSNLSNLADPVLGKQLAPGHGHAVKLTDLGDAYLMRPEDIHALADQLAEEQLLEEMSSYGKRTTGIENTIWISPRATSDTTLASRSQSIRRTRSAREAKTPPSRLPTEVSLQGMRQPGCLNRSRNSLRSIVMS